MTADDYPPIIYSDSEALDEIFPGARVRPSMCGYTWQVHWEGAHLSVPLREPTEQRARTEARRDFVAGKSGRFQLDDMEAAGIPYEPLR